MIYYRSFYNETNKFVSAFPSTDSFSQLSWGLIRLKFLYWNHRFKPLALRFLLQCDERLHHFFEYLSVQDLSCIRLERK